MALPEGTPRGQQSQTYHHPFYSESGRKNLAAELLFSVRSRPAANFIVDSDDYRVQHDGHRLPNKYQTGPFGVHETRRVRSSAVSFARFTGENTDEAVVVFSRGSASVVNVAVTRWST
jgi:hypothetical protein